MSASSAFNAILRAARVAADSFDLLLRDDAWFLAYLSTTLTASGIVNRVQCGFLVANTLVISCKYSNAVGDFTDVMQRTVNGATVAEIFGAAYMYARRSAAFRSTILHCGTVCVFNEDVVSLGPITVPPAAINGRFDSDSDTTLSNTTLLALLSSTTTLSPAPSPAPSPSPSPSTSTSSDDLMSVE